MQLPPGLYTVTVSCGYCEDAMDTIEVRADRENVFHLRAA